MIKRECDYIQAAKNVQGFDIREIDYFDLIEFFKPRLSHALKSVSRECSLNTDKLKFIGVDYDCEKEVDTKYYVSVLLTFELENTIYNLLSVKLTPFSAKLVDIRNKYWCNENVDNELTLCWQEFMRSRFGKEWRNAYLRHQLEERKAQRKYGELASESVCEDLSI